jgi:serine phosphatase RsbU (regulator of sigma subunit)
MSPPAVISFDSEAGLRLLQLFFTSVPLTFAVIHLLLFAFDRRMRRNLYFAVLAASFAGLAFLDIEEDIIGSLAGTPLGVLQWVMVPVMLLSVARFTYDLFYDDLPRQFWGFVAASAVLFLLSFWRFDISITLGKLLVLVVIAETFRASIARWHQRRAEVAIPAFGMAFFGITGAADMLTDLGMIPPPLGLDDPYMFGGVVMLLSMSIHLARSFARNRRDLETQLVRVQDLSEAMLEQERAIREEEIRRRLIEADHERKTVELEDARALQISLLPSEFPELERYEIAATMRTATEVGGDYYDFHVDEDQTLTVIVGDAVGHGARSGIMVAAAKSLFSALVAERDVATMLSRFNEAIRGMGLRRMHMAMTIARFRPGSIEIAAAAMPPPLLRRASGIVDEIGLSGTPLGSWSGPYTSRTVAFSSGDLLLLTSDGLPELRAGNEEPLGFNHGPRILRSITATSARDAIAILSDDIEQRIGTGTPDDDVTLLAVYCR